MVAREKFSSQAPAELLEEMRAIARKEGRQFQAVLEDAMRAYIVRKSQHRLRPEVMAHAWASVHRHRLLYELLAKDD